MRWFNVSVLWFVLLFGSASSLLLAQEEQKPAAGEGEVTITVPEQTMLGKWVKISITGDIKQPHIVRVLHITSKRDRDVTILDGESTVIPLGPNTYAYSAPLVGEFVVELVAIHQDRPLVKDALFKVVADIPPAPEPTPEPAPNPPGPNPTPDDMVNKAPFPSPDGLRVLIIEETADRLKLPAGQQEILLSWEVRQWLANNTVREQNSAGYRIWDDDYTAEQLNYVSETWRLAYERAKKDSAGKLPWLVAANRNKGFSGPLPNTNKELLDLLNSLK